MIVNYDHTVITIINYNPKTFIVQATGLNTRYLQYWLFQLLAFLSPKFKHFEPVSTRPKFCGKLLKAPKEKLKENEIHWIWTKSKYYTVKFQEI
jgi:hypothetical protein